MKNIYNNSSRRRDWIAAVIATILLLSVPLARAQQGSSGNTYIFGGAEMTFFGTHDFTNGGSGALPGIIGTVRGPSSIGILNFASTASHSGGSDTAHVDGYVRKYGTTSFVFPVGDNGFYGPFAASGDGTMGAYYHGDASAAVTSDLGGGDYPVLPLGGPFPVTTFEDALEAVSPIEYWDIDGTNATPLTLTWDEGSSIAPLITSQLNKLTIVGWNGTQWVAIPSKVDTTSVLGGISDLTAGSITTTAAIVPNTFTAYTLASRDTPLPVTLVRFNAVKEGSTALLTWSTTEETNSDHFEVERSRDGNDWGYIGAVESTGESKVLVDYHFLDAHPLAEENLYRLKMIDRDGTFAYSRIRNVQFENLEKGVVYPNPVNDKLFVKDLAKIVSMRILDVSGEVVLRSGTLKDGGIDISKLAAGIHVVEITWPYGEKTTQKILIRE